MLIWINDIWSWMRFTLLIGEISRCTCDSLPCGCTNPCSKEINTVTSVSVGKWLLIIYLFLSTRGKEASFRTSLDGVWQKQLIFLSEVHLKTCIFSLRPTTHSLSLSATYPGWFPFLSSFCQITTLNSWSYNLRMTGTRNAIFLFRLSAFTEW